MMFFHITLYLSYLISPYSSVAFSDDTHVPVWSQGGGLPPPSPEEIFLTGGLTETVYSLVKEGEIYSKE